ncbi:MAG: hypothetical protein ACI35O_13905 [Bacillaceae bacterium]
MTNNNEMSFNEFKVEALKRLQKQFLGTTNTKDTVLTRKNILEMIKDLNEIEINHQSFTNKKDDLHLIEFKSKETGDTYLIKLLREVKVANDNPEVEYEVVRKGYLPLKDGEDKYMRAIEEIKNTLI